MKTAVISLLAQACALVGLSACFGLGLIAWSGKVSMAAPAPGQENGQKRAQKVGEGNAAASDTAISDADAQQFTAKMVKAIRSNDVPTIASLIDVEALAKAAMADLNLANTDMDEFMLGVKKGMKSSMTSKVGLPAQISASVANGGACDLLRYLEANHQKRARLRMISANNGGLNYLDLVIGRNAEGQVMAQDIYIFYSGELLSQTMHRLGLQLAAQRNNQSVLERLQGKEADFLKHADDFRKIGAAISEKRAHDAAQIYNSLPDNLKKDKSLQLAHVRIAALQGDAAYSRALTEFRASFPNDPACELLSVDYYILRKEYDKAQGAVDILDKAVGGDPYLNVTRAVLHIAQREMSPAQGLMEKAAQAMPANKDVQALLVVISLQNKRYEAVLNALLALKKAGEAPPDIAHDPDFAGFRHSPQYEQWKKAQ